jgi:hypothetical protein
VSKKSQKSVRGNIRGNNLQISRPVTKRPQKTTAAKLRSWRVSIIRKRAQHLGVVAAPNEKAAEAAAVTQFKLSDEQRKRLVVQERD